MKYKDVIMPQPAPKKPDHPLSSKTTPQLVNMFRRIMLLDEIMSVREARYKESLKTWNQDIKNPPKGLDVKDPEVYLRTKHREFYSHELSVTAAFEADEKRLEEIIESDPEFSKVYKEAQALPENKRQAFLAEPEVAFLASLSPEEQAEFKKLKQDVSMGLDVQMRASYFTPEFIKNSPDHDVAREKVRNMIRASAPADMKGVKAEHAGVVKLFNQKYQGLSNQLTALADKYPSQVKVAKALLKTGSITLNPSGMLIGRGIGVIMQTKAFKKLSDKIDVHVNRVAEKTGLKRKIIEKLQSPKGEAYKKLALGSVAAMGTFMTLTSLIDHDQALELYAGAQDMLENAASIKDNFSIENGEALVDNLKNTGAEALSDLSKEMEDKLPDFGFGDSAKDAIEADKPDLPDTSIAPSPQADMPDASSKVDASEPALPTSTVPEITDDAVPEPEDAPKVNAVENDVTNTDNEPMVEDPLPEPVALPENVYELQPGDTASEIAELRLKEAGIPYDYDKIMKVVHMIADANEGMDNIHYVQAGADLTLPALDASLVDNYTIPEPEPVIENNVDLTLPPTVDFSGAQIASEMDLSEEIQSRFEAANMVYSAADIDVLTNDVLLSNGLAGEIPKDGAYVDMKMIDDIVSVHGVDAPKNAIAGIESNILDDSLANNVELENSNDMDGLANEAKLDKPFEDLPSPTSPTVRR